MLKELLGGNFNRRKFVKTVVSHGTIKSLPEGLLRCLLLVDYSVLICLLSWVVSVLILTSTLELSRIYLFPEY